MNASRRRFLSQEQYVSERNAMSRHIGAEHGLTASQADVLEDLTTYRHEIHSHPETYSIPAAREMCDKVVAAGLPLPFHVPLFWDTLYVMAALNDEIERFLGWIDRQYGTSYRPTHTNRRRRTANAT